MIEKYILIFGPISLSSLQGSEAALAPPGGLSLKNSLKRLHFPIDHILPRSSTSKTSNLNK